MCQAACNSFQALVAVRVLGGAVEATADPALVSLESHLSRTTCANPVGTRFMIITGMFYTRREQPLRIGIWYLANGIGVRPSLHSFVCAPV
jgi:hypothetical protein